MHTLFLQHTCRCEFGCITPACVGVAPRSRSAPRLVPAPAPGRCAGPQMSPCRPPLLTLCAPASLTNTPNSKSRTPSTPLSQRVGRRRHSTPAPTRACVHVHVHVCEGLRGR